MDDHRKNDDRPGPILPVDPPPDPHSGSGRSDSGRSEPGRCEPLSRRNFVTVAAAGSAAVLAAGSCAPSTESNDGGGASSAAGTNGASGALDLTEFELDEITVSEMQDGYASGRWSAEAVTQLYLERIAEVNPELRAVIETNPDALAIAAGLDQERAAGQVRGPLHGIPVLIKDNIGTADGMETTAGSFALVGAKPRQDAHVAARLREEGAILIGKANLSEWANFRSTRSSSGWSGRGGQCSNPYVLDRNPCGSSSGSGAGVSANLATLAVGTETNGSVVCPSSASGLVGIKPTIGLVSRSRIIPISHTQDTAGPMTRTVRDGAVLLGGMTGADPEDPPTGASDGRAYSNYTQFLDPAGLRGARVGVAREYFGFDPHVDALMEEAIEAMRASGAEIIDPVEVPNRQQMNGPSYQVMLYEFKADMAAYLGDLPASNVRSMADLIAFNEANAAREMPYFGQEIFLEAEAKGPLSEAGYIEVLTEATRMSGPDGVDALMETHQLDAVVSPTGGPAWTTDLVNGDHFTGGSSSPAAISGYPNVTVPAGFVFGLPVGISFWGRAWSEPTLLRLAYSFEQATNHRAPPGFLRTAAL